MKTKSTAIIIATALILGLAGCEDNTSSLPAISLPDSSVTSNDSEASDETTSDAAESTLESSTNTDEESEAPDVQGGEMSGNILVCADGRGIVLFGGDSGGGAVYADSLNKVKEAVGDYVNVFSMIVPTSGSFYMPDGFSMASEWDAIQNINNQMNGIIPVDVYTALSKHTSEEIYSRTDHHWMQLGAYYAAEEFVKTAQIDVPFAPLSDYEEHVIEGYLGTLYGYSDYNAVMGKNPENFVYYVPQNNFTTNYMNPSDTDFYVAAMIVSQPVEQSYSMFMGGDEKVIHVETDVDNGRRLLIVKDSYANAMVPCLTGSFEDIWWADMRYLQEMENFPTSISEIVKEYDITDVLFCMNTFSAVGAGSYLPYII